MTKRRGSSSGARRGGQGDPEVTPEPGASEEVVPAGEPGVMLRPEAVVLGDEALVPDANLVRPPPNRFTHELGVDEPYRFDRPGRQDREPDGVLPAGTPVVVLVEGGDHCRVVDGTGLYVRVRRSSLRERTRDD